MTTTNTKITNATGPAAHYKVASLTKIGEADKKVKELQSECASQVSTFNDDADAFAKRSKSALATMLANAYVAVEELMASAQPDQLARILQEHQVHAAAGSTSIFTPWMKIAFGAHDPEGTIVNFQGRDGVKWKADKGFQRYVHVWETFRAEKITENHAAVILERGGAVAMAEARKAALAAQDAPKAATIKAQRELLLTEGASSATPLPLNVGAITGEFFALTCQKTAEGYVVLGVYPTGADGADKQVAKLAAAKFDALTKAKAERLAEEERRAAVMEELMLDPTKSAAIVERYLAKQADAEPANA